MPAESSVQTPSWVADAVFYQIFADRFATDPMVAKPRHLEAWDAPPTARGFKGGDFEGIRRRLDYLQDLGVTALYFTPVFSSTANHRYHTYDYFQIDPLLGGNRAFRAFMKDAKARGLRVVFDGVFNHASRGFFQFNHTLENGAASPYLDWFTFNRAWLASGKPLNAYEPMPTLAVGPTQEAGLERLGYRAWWDLAALPKLNFDCSEVRAYMLDVAVHWLDEGIDGWRLDVPQDIPDDFWRAFRVRVKAANPEAYLVGEIWYDASRWLRGDQFDAVMNYLVGKAILGFTIGAALNTAELQRCGGYRDVYPLTAEAYGAHIDGVLTLYPEAVTRAQMNLLGSHDTPRLATIANGREGAVRLALFLLFTFPGTPRVYYGDEIGLEGGQDPACRAGFPWDETRWDESLHAYVRELARTRHATPALRQGSYRSLHAADGLYAFERCTATQSVVGLVNVSDEPRDVALPRAAGSMLRRRLAPRSSELVVEV